MDNPIGKKFNRLTVISLSPVRSSSRGKLYVFQCDCGNITKPQRLRAIRNGVVKSCGCLNKELTSKRSKTHGKSKTKQYKAYIGMKQRCSNPNYKQYKDYGGRGISVCKRWEESYENFLQDMGDRPKGKELDRINNDGNYEPGNCRWVTSLENKKTSSNTRKIDYQGVTYSLTELSSLLGIPPSTLSYRIKKGIPLES